MTRGENLPQALGLCFIDQSRRKAVVRLRTRHPAPELVACLLAYDFRFVSTTKGGGKVFEQGLGVASERHTMQCVIGFCRKNPDILFATPDAGAYYLPLFPYVAVKTPDGFTVHRNSLSE